MGKEHYVCQSCGNISAKWKGKCESCQTWNSFVLENISFEETKKSSESLNLTTLSDFSDVSFERIPTPFKELDRVLGGGIVLGSVSLIAGDPGIGKSTLLLQVAALLSKNISVAYISGEEGIEQIRLRAKRLDLLNYPLHLASSNHLSSILPALSLCEWKKEASKKSTFVIIDSIQTMSSSRSESAPGTLSQVRECAQELVTFAKQKNIAVMMVGHITKEGMVAGPKTLEHMVDTVLYFEGERSHPYRLLRTIKNRFGPTDEIGVFDMTDQGLKEVLNPSALFLSHRTQEVPGACVFAGIEGTRPLLVEIQALTTPSFLASPRRAVVGWDHNRLSMILAVLEARCKINFSQKDVFLSVLGGLKITEPAADLCVALALLSCIKKRPLPAGAIAFGEIGLTGEIRPVGHADQRLKEANKLGFSQAFLPFYQKELKTPLSLQTLDHIKKLSEFFA